MTAKINHVKKYSVILIILLLLLFSINSCKPTLPVEKRIYSSFQLINQDSAKVIFPNDFKGKILVIGFIFTNCPDICPLTTNNLQLIQQRLKNEKVNNVEVAALSFDPNRDTPKVLKKFAEIRDIDLDNFEFLTGEKNIVDSLISVMGVKAYSGDTTYTKSGEPVYFYVHTDRISLIDQNGNVRKEYRGSRIDLEEIISDIKSIGE